MHILDILGLKAKNAIFSRAIHVLGQSTKGVFMLFLKKFRPFCKKIQIKGLLENCSRAFLFQLALLNCVAKISATGTAFFSSVGTGSPRQLPVAHFGELLLANKYYAVYIESK
jgi:hypothetical protein